MISNFFHIYYEIILVWPLRPALLKFTVMLVPIIIFEESRWNSCTCMQLSDVIILGTYCSIGLVGCWSFTSWKHPIEGRGFESSLSQARNLPNVYLSQGLDFKPIRPMGFGKSMLIHRWRCDASWVMKEAHRRCL